MLILVLEASTSSAKAMLYQSTVGIIDVLNVNHSAAAGDIATYDADMIINETILVGQELLKRNNTDKVDLVAACSIWSHSLLMLDRDKRPISPLKTWADTSASEITEKYRQNDQLFNELYLRTGCPIHTTYTLWKYLHEKEQGNTGSTAFIATMPDYLFLKLTEEFAISKSTASAGGFLNIHTLDWDQAALKLAGISDTMLPRLVESEYLAPLAPTAAISLGIKAGTPVLITGADGCMNQVASGAFGDLIMTISVGTSAAMRLSIDKPILAERPSTWCYLGVEQMWIAGSATAGAGNCVDWMGKQILGFNGQISLKELDQGASFVPGKKQAPIFMPFLAGERCPGWDDTKTAIFYGLNNNHDIYDMYYAVLEGVLFNLKQCYDITIPIVGQPPKLISISGGIEKSPFWLSMAATIFGLPVYTGDLSHASLLGAALMGLKAQGELASVKEIEPVLDKKWDPDFSKQDYYQQRYVRYLQYYDKS